MRAPNPAESLSPFPNTEIANRTYSPIDQEARTPHRSSRAIGRATVGLVAAASLASLGASTPAQEAGHIEATMGHASTANSRTLDTATQVGYESQNIYTGRVAITTAQRAKTEREPSVTESDGVSVAKIMGIPPANVTQGKNADVTVGGYRIDLADYVTTSRKAEPWTNARTGDCLWNFAIQDIGVAFKKAGATPQQTETAMKSTKNIQRVIGGYFVDNPELKQDPKHYLKTGKVYVAKHARQEADELVAAMRAAAKPQQAAPKNPDLAQPQPDTNPVHTVPKSENRTSFKEMAISAGKVLGGSLLGLAALVGAASGTVGLMRRRRRRQEEAEMAAATEAASGKHRSPDPNKPTTPPDTPVDFSDLRKITEDDEKNGHDPVDPPRGAHADRGDSDKSPFAPPVESARAAESSAATTAPTDIRARFGAPRLIEPLNKRRLRSVPISGTQTDTVMSVRRAFAQAATMPEANIKDAPTDPAGASVYAFPVRRTMHNPGWHDPVTGEKLAEYRGRHRKPVAAAPAISRVTVHRPAYASDVSVVAM